MREQQRQDDSYESERRHAQNDEQAADALQLEHQDDQHQQSGSRQHRGHGGQRLCALFDRTAGHDLIALRELGVHLVDFVLERGDDRRGQNAVDQIGLHCDGRQTIPPPDQRPVQAVLHGRHLQQGHGPAIGKRDFQRLQH